MAKKLPPDQSSMVPVPSCPAVPPMTRDVLTQATWVQPVPQPRIREDASKPPIKVASCGLRSDCRRREKESELGQKV